jgi:hypothetical protein
MVLLPDGFVQLDRLPGYYWNVIDKQLYSCKSGILKPMVKKKAYRGHIPGGGYVDAKEGYQVSVNGIHKKISYQWLLNIKVPVTTQVFPVTAGGVQCPHDNQLWNILFTSGHCKDCGTALQGNTK